VIHSAEEASHFAKELQLLLRTLGVSDANMEKGEMRVEANISLSSDQKVLGTKVEVKNLNSFKSVERAILYELERMRDLHDSGNANQIVQETRGWDESKGITFSQRKKEGSADYRYFPDPDLPKMKLHSAFNLAKMKTYLPELPLAKRARYQKEFGIKDEDIEVYINDPDLAGWFEEVANILIDVAKVKTASNYVTSDFMGLKKANKNTTLPSSAHFVEMIEMLSENKISSRGAKDILAMIVLTDDSPLSIATKKNIIQTNDKSAITAIAEIIIAQNPEVVDTYMSGKENAIMSLVGKVIKESNGSANPQMVIHILKKLLQ